MPRLEVRDGVDRHGPTAAGECARVWPGEREGEEPMSHGLPPPRNRSWSKLSLRPKTFVFFKGPRHALAKGL